MMSKQSSQEDREDEGPGYMASPIKYRKHITNALADSPGFKEDSANKANNDKELDDAKNGNGEQQDEEKNAELARKSEEVLL